MCHGFLCVSVWVTNEDNNTLTRFLAVMRLVSPHGRQRVGRKWAVDAKSVSSNANPVHFRFTFLSHFWEQPGEESNRPVCVSTNKPFQAYHLASVFLSDTSHLRRLVSWVANDTAPWTVSVTEIIVEVVSEDSHDVSFAFLNAT